MAQATLESFGPEFVPHGTPPHYQAWAFIRSQKLLAISGLIILVYLLVGVFGPLLAPKNPFEIRADAILLAPGSRAWFGTDQEGRDQLSRLLVGTRYTLLGAYGVMLIATGGGFFLGLVTAYVGGWFDRILMRIFDTLLSFPPLVLAILLVAAIGPGLIPSIVGVGIGYLPGIGRIIRSEAIIQREQQYVLAGQGLGLPAWRLVFAHIMPNCTSQLIVQASMNLPYAIIDIAGLSFLGFGVQPPTPDWGSMLANGQRYLFTGAWLILIPGAFVSLLVISWNIFGARLRAALDPRNL